MTQPIEGTQPQEQPSSGTPPQVEQAHANGQPSQAAPAQPTVEQLQAQLDSERQQREHFQNQYQALQPEYTRARQALANLAGAPTPQAPQDPVAQYVSELTSQGYDEKSARAVASVVYKMTQSTLAPLQQELQVTRNASGIDYAVNQAMQMAPQLFTSPADYDAARQAATAHVQAGGQLDPRMIVSVVNDNRFWQSMRTPQQPQQAAQPLPTQPFANGFNRVGGGFQPPQQRANAPLGKEAQDLQNEINNRYKKQ